MNGVVPGELLLAEEPVVLGPDVGPELTIRNTGDRPVQAGSCITPWGETVRFCVDDARGGRLNGLRVYAGLRWSF